MLPLLTAGTACVYWTKHAGRTGLQKDSLPAHQGECTGADHACPVLATENRHVCVCVSCLSRPGYRKQTRTHARVCMCVSPMSASTTVSAPVLTGKF